VKEAIFLHPSALYCSMGFAGFAEQHETDKQQEKASRQTHAKDSANLTRKTEEQKSTNGKVQRVTTCK
jgi:hypothetical protein